MGSDKQWEVFGYRTTDGCEICKEKPAKIEPRFAYISCREHAKLSPVGFSNLRDTLVTVRKEVKISEISKET